MAISTENAIPSFDETADRLRDANERITAESRKAGLTAVEAYEKTGWGLAELQARVAKASQVDWLTRVLDAQADFTRTVVSAQASAARSVLS